MVKIIKRIIDLSFVAKKRITEPMVIRKIMQFYNKDDIDSEISEALAFIKSNGIQPIPYSWVKQYDHKLIEVEYDNNIGLPYILFDKKKLFYPESMSKTEIQKSFNAVQNIEQNHLSPHKYLIDDFIPGKDDVVVDCGVAEGNFGLSVVEKVSKLFLFEPKPIWYKPLEATFLPWKDKVEIVNKYVSDHDSDMNISLDTFFAKKKKPTYLKLDIEGFEEQALRGSSSILSCSSVDKMIICTYHYSKDYDKLSQFVLNSGFSFRPSSGYMMFCAYEGFVPPYFRIALIHCKRNKE